MRNLIGVNNKMGKKKVLHIVGAMNKGGTETMLMNIYRNINREYIQFDFISFSEEEAYYNEEIKSLGGKVINISLDKRINKSVKKICKVIKNHGPYDIVHAHTLFNCGIAMMAAKKNNISIRISHSHTTLNVDDSVMRNIYSKLMRFIINRNSTNLLACSHEAGRFLFGDKQLNLPKYDLLPNLVDYNRMLKNPKLEVEKFKEDNNLNDYLVIGHIGTLKECKNQKFLIEITKYLVKANQNVKLLLVGDGSMRIELQSLVYKYNLEKNVVFAGIRDDIDVMLHSIDVFVFPSTYEGLGLVLLEAQASGLPCIVSEAIQPEADLGIGLLNKLNLSNGAEKWSEEILKVNGVKERDINKIIKAFEEKGYSTDKCISKLMKLYDIN